MRNLPVKLSALLLVAATVYAWTDPPPIPEGTYIFISRISTSDTRSDDFLPEVPFGYDYGDTNSAITANFGGAAFEFGQPLQIEFYMTSPTSESNSTWRSVQLDYMQGTNSAANTNWITIAKTANISTNEFGIKGAHLGQVWEPPSSGYYLVRIYAETTTGLTSADLSAVNITKDGDGITWDDSEIVLIRVRDNSKPGAGY